MTPLVLRLNEQGVPQQWATWQDAVIYKAKNLVVWETGEYDWTKYGGTNRLTGLTSSITFSSIIAVKGLFQAKRTTPALNNENLFRRDLQLCAYCGKEYSYSYLTNDHIVPRSRGGAHAWMNCVTSCRRCNNHKSDRLLSEVGMELLYVPYVPSPEEHLIMKNRVILADQMAFLKPMLPSHSRMHKITTYTG